MSNTDQEKSLLCDESMAVDDNDAAVEKNDDLNKNADEEEVKETGQGEEGKEDVEMATTTTITSQEEGEEVQTASLIENEQMEMETDEDQRVVFNSENLELMLKQEQIDIEENDQLNEVNTNTNVNVNLNVKSKCIVTLYEDDEKEKEKDKKKCKQCQEEKEGGVKYRIVMEENGGDVEDTNLIKVDYLCGEECLNKFKEEHSDKYEFNEEQLSEKKTENTNTQRKLRVKVFSPQKPSTITSSELANSSSLSSTNNTDFLACSPMPELRRMCKQCTNFIKEDKPSMAWEGWEFCGVYCLKKTQSTFGINCSLCQKIMDKAIIGKYCLRFGTTLKQFCSTGCVEKIKKEWRVCKYCQQKIPPKNCLKPQTTITVTQNDNRGGTSVYFYCDSLCKIHNEKIEKPITNNKQTQVCGVCYKEKIVEITLKNVTGVTYFCGEPCFVAYKFVNQLSPGQCKICQDFATREVMKAYSLYYKNEFHFLCSDKCKSIYIVSNRKIAYCYWCKVKKYNFDMIEQHDGNNDSNCISMCSIPCFELFNNSLKAVKNAFKCEQCGLRMKPKYHLTMSNSNIKNFCSYGCLVIYQAYHPIENKYISTSTSSASSSTSSSTVTSAISASSNTISPSSNVPAILKKKSPMYYKKSKLKNIASNDNVNVSVNQTNQNLGGGGNDGNEIKLPVITKVQSLAKPPPLQALKALTVVNTQPSVLSQPPSLTSIASMPPPMVTTTADLEKKFKQMIFVKPAPIPMQRNVATMVKPILLSKETSTCSTTTINEEGNDKDKDLKIKKEYCDQGTQTECLNNDKDKEKEDDGEVKEKKILLPIPVPIFVPVPLHMYSQYVPFPTPFPLPIPVPVFIPTTRNSAKGIMKEINKIKTKVPNNPLEAELLMMAELVAEDKKQKGDKNDTTSSSSSSSDVDDPMGEVEDGDDEEEEDDEEDELENEVIVEENRSNNEEFGDVLQMALKMATDSTDFEPLDLDGAVSSSTISVQKRRVEKRKGSSSLSNSKSGGKKKDRRISVKNNASSCVSSASAAEKPDANMCLKYTFGVNAWKQWVTTKNSELEKSNKKQVLLFKTDILQLTADELNYSLCHFVKEVRKPNGSEYAPDTIYYLCLGIQQYLYENGRIDNIFCDAFYDKFTECLNDVCKRFSVLYNDSQFIVTRVEEEHLWESKQLGAHSPLVLINTLMFFNTKHFSLTTVDEHLQLSFSHIMKHWKRNPNTPGSRNVMLRFYPPQNSASSTSTSASTSTSTTTSTSTSSPSTTAAIIDDVNSVNKSKKKMYEQQENVENPLRCPVKLYEFYLSKCPESVKTRNDVFYLLPERSCVPDSPLWYSTMALEKPTLEKMLNRIKMIKEINVALLNNT